MITNDAPNGVLGNDGTKDAQLLTEHATDEQTDNSEVKSVLANKGIIYLTGSVSLTEIGGSHGDVLLNDETGGDKVPATISVSMGSKSAALRPAGSKIEVNIDARHSDGLPKDGTKYVLALLPSDFYEQATKD